KAWRAPALESLQATREFQLRALFLPQRPPDRSPCRYLRPWCLSRVSGAIVDRLTAWQARLLRLSQLLVPQAHQSIQRRSRPRGSSPRLLANEQTDPIDQTMSTADSSLRPDPHRKG